MVGAVGRRATCAAVRCISSAAPGTGLRLVADGPELFAEDRQLLGRLAAAAARALEDQQLAGRPPRPRELAEVDRLRTALLAAVGHDLRTPLAGIKAAVVQPARSPTSTWTPGRADELLATVEESADRLDDLVENLLAMSRLQAGVLSVDLRPVALDEVVARALSARTARTSSASTSPTTCRSSSPTRACSNGWSPTWSPTP